MTTWKDFEPENPVHPTKLPWYVTLRMILEPYKPAEIEIESDVQFSTAELIKAIEEHHGVPQGVVGKQIHQFVLPEDFVRTMHYCGYKEVNMGGTQLEWLLKKL